MAGFYYFIKNQHLAKAYFISSAGNEPTLPFGTQLFVSNLYHAKNGDFIAFDHFSDLVNKEMPHIFRKVAGAGDTIEIKQGTVYVNSKNIDTLYALKHQYIIQSDAVLKVDRYLNPLDYSYPTHIVRSDSLLIHLVDSIAMKHNFTRYISPPTQHDILTEALFDQFWNKDKFGPLIIPEGKLFVLGDNRDNAMDSRFIGLIDQEKVLGVARKK